MKALIHVPIIFLWIMLLFLRIGQMSRSKGKLPTKRSYHKDYSCEIYNSGSHW